jgi:PPM family protein phosphatase
MEIQPGNAQWQGARDEQQDAFGFLGFDHPALRAHGGVLLVLADGMGGLSGGRQASRLAVERMMAAYAAKRPDEPIPAALERALQAANQAVYDLACAREGEGQVGTTLVAVVACGAQLHWVGVGDSRLYHYRAADDTLTQCTDDHTYANQLLRQVAEGLLSPEAAAADPDRQALASFLGLARIPEIDRNLHPVDLAPGDRLLVLSDGVYGVVPEAELKTLVRQDPQAAAEALIQALQDAARPDQDNATAALLGLAADAHSPGCVPTERVPGAGARFAWWRRRLIAVILLGVLAALPGFYFLWTKGTQDSAPDPKVSGAAGLDLPSSIEAGAGRDTEPALPPEPEVKAEPELRKQPPQGAPVKREGGAAAIPSPGGSARPLVDAARATAVPGP